MNNLTSFYYYHNSKANILDVILHGGSVGIDSLFMQKIFQKSKEKGNSVIMFNFPYFERGEEHSSGPELKEELKTLEKILDMVNAKDYQHIRLIGKSLGGIVTSYYLRNLKKDEQKRYEVIILGFVVGEVDLRSFRGGITIVQREKDKFGDIEVVKRSMKGASSSEIYYFEIKGADHSFRDPQTKEPIFEDEAIARLSS